LARWVLPGPSVITAQQARKDLPVMTAHPVKRVRWAQWDRQAQSVRPATKAIPAPQARMVLKASLVQQVLPARPAMMVRSDPRARLAPQVSAALPALLARQVRKA